MPSPIRHAPEIRARFPQLRVAALLIEGLTPAADPSPAIARLEAAARHRLASASESEFREIQAWRRAFAAMGLKPTQYRCASEALLRRYRKEGALPALHPLIDLCNATSLAFAIPVAAFDIARVEGTLTVRPAKGDETYETFAGETEHPEPGEIIFADDAGRAHARRWTNRQSGWSAVRSQTARALIVAEALHAGAEGDLGRLAVSLADDLAAAWPACRVTPVKTG